MTQQVPTGEISFKLAFGIETVILLEIGFHILRVEEFDEDSNFIGLRANLILLEKIQERA